MEFDCNCACALPPRDAAPSQHRLPDDTFVKTCQPIYRQPFLPDYDLVLAPSSPSTLAVINSPARRVLEFFKGGRTVKELIENSVLLENTCRETVETLWHAGLIELSSQSNS